MAISTSKFYYFDLGVRNHLARIKSLPEKGELVGQAFEHFIALEIRAALSYQRRVDELSFWRTKNGHEVDFIIGDTTAVEVKSTSKVTDKHLKGLKILAEENICKNYICVSLDERARKVGNILILPWKRFLEDLSLGKY